MRVGFIGLGNMGRGMAGNVKRAGFEMVISDLRREAAEPFLGDKVIWADTPRAVAEASDIVLTSLPKPADVDTVARGDKGLIAGLAAGSAWFDLSTNSLDLVHKLNAELASRDVAFLDAPVSGGVTGAAAGTLAIWVGGDRTVYDRYLPVLEAMADKPRFIGAIGAGTIAKLVHNLASAAMNQVVAECMTLGVKAGLPPLELFEAIRGGAAGRMRGFDSVSRRWMQGKLDPASFELQLLHKDVALAMDLARDVEVPMPHCALALEELSAALDRGWARRDQQSVHVLQQERAGIEPLAIPAEEIAAVMARS